MIFTAPMPFIEAQQSAEVRSILPTTGKTAQLQQLDGDIRRRALFSATVTNVTHLQKIEDLRDGILSGRLGLDEARLQIKSLLAEQGYEPDPEERGGLRDLSSTARINLQLETNVDVARGAGWFAQGQDPVVLDAFPAQELVRFFGPDDPSRERDWAARWAICGGTFYGGRMIALKTDPIWRKLGDPALFPDGLGNEFPPFAFHSGMDVVDISRDEAESLGLLDSDTELLPQNVDLNAELQATPDVRSEWLRQALTDSGLGDYVDGVFVFKEAA